MRAGNTVFLIVGAVFLLICLLMLVFFARIFRLWLRALLGGAPISLPNILLMRLRRAPVEEIVRLKIMAAQSGVDIPVSKIESAALQGIDIERAVLALIRAREMGMEVSWEELISQDLSERLKDKLFPG